MEQSIIERDLREEMVFWLEVENDALLRGGEIDLKIAHYASGQRRKYREDLLTLWDGVPQINSMFRSKLSLNEKQHTGVGSDELYLVAL